MKKMNLIFRRFLTIIFVMSGISNFAIAQSISSSSLAPEDRLVAQRFDFSQAAKDVVNTLTSTGSNQFRLTQIYPARAFTKAEIYELHGYVDLLIYAGKINPQYAAQLHNGLDSLEHRYASDISANLKITLPENYRQAFVAGWFAPILLVFIPVIVEVLNLALDGDFLPPGMEPGICLAPEIRFPDGDSELEERIEEILNDPDFTEEQKRSLICAEIAIAQEEFGCIRDDIKDAYAYCWDEDQLY